MSETRLTAVGERIKAIREKKEITLQQLAQKTGYTSALLNQIENHMMSPPLGALGKIANALGVRIGELWGEDKGGAYALVRKDERPSASSFASKEGVSYGYSYQSLGFGMKDRHIESYFVVLEPPTVKNPKPSVHDGEEFLFVLSGRMEVFLGDHADILEAGDSIQFDATIPHRVSCAGEEKTQIVAVIWSPGK